MMDGHLEQIRRNFGLPSIEDEDQFMGEKVEEQMKEVPVSREIPIKNEVVEVYEPRIPYPQRLIEVTMEHENSLPKDLMENMKKKWWKTIKEVHT
ncbi:hypothetical protein AHAS_Ahas20G0198000 [Arachis hypogaea]